MDSYLPGQLELLGDTPPETAATVSMKVAAQEQRGAIVKRLLKLKPHYLEGLSAARLADELQLEIGVVKARLRELQAASLVQEAGQSDRLPDGVLVRTFRATRKARALLTTTRG